TPVGPPISTLFPYTTLFRSQLAARRLGRCASSLPGVPGGRIPARRLVRVVWPPHRRSAGSVGACRGWRVQGPARGRRGGDRLCRAAPVPAPGVCDRDGGGPHRVGPRPGRRGTGDRRGQGRESPVSAGAGQGWVPTGGGG